MSEGTNEGYSAREVPHNKPETVPTNAFITDTMRAENKTVGVIESAIEKNGEIPFSQFMDISLRGPHGYYTIRSNVVGPESDFITSAESKRTFWEGMRVASSKVWESMDKPQDFSIIEMGAGSGRLAKGILRSARLNNPEFYNALIYTIVDYSQGLIATQRRTVNGDERFYKSKDTQSENEQDVAKVKWLRASATQLPFPENSIDGVILSCELPDTFAVELVKKIHGKIKQKYITLENGQFIEVWKEPSNEVTAYINDQSYTVGEESEVPINLSAVQWQRGLDRVLNKGAIITQDYGQYGMPIAEKPELGLGYRIYPTDIDADRPEYAYPGAVDITTDVDFKALEHVAQKDGMHTAFFGPEKDFLAINGFHSSEGDSVQVFTKGIDVAFK